MTGAIAIRLLRQGSLAATLLFWAALSALAPAPARAQSFALSGVSFTPSDYLDDAALQSAVAPYLNRPITFADVQSMLADVQALYTARGVVTAQVVIEPQEVADGVLRLTLVEAVIEAVDVEDVPRTSPGFLADRLSLREGGKPDFDRLARDLRLFEVAYDLRPRLSFGAGEAPATARATISAQVPPARSWTLSLDNSASAALGRAQLSVSGVFRSVTGVRDTLAAKLSLTQGSQSLLVDYARPLGLKGGMLSAQASYVNTKIVSGEFSAIDVANTETSAALGYAQPFAITPDRYWSAYGRAHYERLDSAVAGAALQTSTLAEIDLGLRYHKQGTNRALVLGGGAKVGQARASNGSATDGSYALIYADASYARQLGTSRWVIDASLKAQIAEGQNLPVKRRLSAGGVESLRGFEKDARTGDSGLLASVELGCGGGCWAFGVGDLSVDPFAFVDLGYVKPFEAPGATGDRDHALASVGAGVKMRWRKATMMAFVGAPVLSPSSLDPSPVRAFVGLDYTF